MDESLDLQVKECMKGVKRRGRLKEEEDLLLCHRWGKRYWKKFLIPREISG